MTEFTREEKAAQMARSFVLGPNRKWHHYCVRSFERGAPPPDLYFQYDSIGRESTTWGCEFKMETDEEKVVAIEWVSRALLQGFIVWRGTHRKWFIRGRSLEDWERFKDVYLGFCC